MYLDKLTNEDFVYLINLCSNTEMNFESMVSSNSIADFALVADEEDRKTVSGERYFWIRGIRRGDIPKFLGEYKASDYWMVSSDGKQDYSDVLKRFMTKKFGEEYVESLYNYRLAQASLETDKLLEYLNLDKEENPSRD